MPTTTNRSLRYPTSSNAPNIPQDIQNLATDTDNAMALIFGKMWRTAGLGPTQTVATEYVVGMDTSRTTGGVTFDNTNDRLTVPIDGLYDVSSCLYVSTNTTGTGQTGGWVRRVKSGFADLATCQGPLAHKLVASVDQRASWVHRMVPLSAGTALALVSYAYDASLTYYGLNEYNGSFLAVTYVAPLAGATPI